MGVTKMNNLPSIGTIFETSFFLFYVSVLCPFLDSQILPLLPSPQTGSLFTGYLYLILYHLISLKHFNDPGQCLIHQFQHKKRNITSLLTHTLVLYTTAIATAHLILQHLPGYPLISWTEPSLSRPLQFLSEFLFTFIVSCSAIIAHKVKRQVPHYVYFHLAVVQLVLMVSRHGFSHFGSQLNSTYTVFSMAARKDVEGGLMLLGAVLMGQISACVVMRGEGEVREVREERRGEEMEVREERREEVREEKIEDVKEAEEEEKKVEEVEVEVKEERVRRRTARVVKEEVEGPKRTIAGREKSISGTGSRSVRRKTPAAEVLNTSTSSISSVGGEGERRKMMLERRDRSESNKPRSLSKNRTQSPIKTRAARARANTIKGAPTAGDTTSQSEATSAMRVRRRVQQI